MHIIEKGRTSKHQNILMWENLNMKKKFTVPSQPGFLLADNIFSYK